MAPRKMKLQMVKAKIGKAEENGKCLKEMERQGHRLRAETEMVMKQTARTQVKVALMFNILKAREGGDFIQAATLTRFLRELVAKETANASSK
ncbi:hypothetical protein HRI_001022000 [Hibiscus trionum]|uniref:Uncharacterized protein n=1 Tax=Hibiscus trionum TaxID=183268 RepID=A0A9W7HAJ5_HIBTR|nr:hypothetical protein HRI_001022000 [Hibiscus trionum]